jgi:glycosyltransferase involved in cell wall biosynthesis
MNRYDYIPLYAPILITEQRWSVEILPIVAVSVATYNHESYISDCIKGILMQKTTFPVHIFVFEDCSTDSTASILKQYEEKYPNLFSVFYQPENTYGKSIRQEKAKPFREARSKGKYIAMCEGDDYWTDSLKLQKQVEFLEANPKISFCFHGASTLKANGEVGKYFKSKHFRNKQIVPKRYFIEYGGGGYCTASAVFRKEIILVSDKYNYLFTLSVGDWAIALKAIVRGEIGYLSDIMSVYRVMLPGSWSKTTSLEKHIEINIELEKILNKFNEDTNYIYAYDLTMAYRRLYFWRLVYKTKNKDFFYSLFEMFKSINKIGLKNTLKNIFKLLRTQLEKIKHI